MNEKEPDSVIVTTSQAAGSNDSENAEDHVPEDKYSYYYKNFIVYGFVIITGFGAVYSSANLLTTFAGKSTGFAALTIASFVAFLSVFVIPAGTRSIGTQRSLVLSYLFLLLFVAGQFYVSPYTIIPAAIFHGLGNSLFWACGAMYLSKLAVDYGARCNINHEKMISFANGHLMGCYGAAILLGNALSSSILFPSDLDEQSVSTGNESCNLRQSSEDIDPYNVYLMVLRGVLLLGSCVAFVTVLFFMDEIKGENAMYSISGFLCKFKKSNTEFLKACIQEKPYVLLGFPITMTSSLVQGYIYGSFPKDYISQCVGVHIVGYATMAYGVTATISGFLTGKIYLAYLPRYVVAIATCLMTLALLTFLLIWEREPNYAFIFVFISLWGVTDGQWNTFAPSYIAHMMHERLDVAYMTYSVCFLLGYFIVFASGFIFDVHGVQWVMVVFVSGSLPLYLLAEWLHKHFEHASVNSKNTDETTVDVEQTEVTSKIDYVYLFVYHDVNSPVYYETSI